MGLWSEAGFEHLLILRTNLLCATRERGPQYHVDVVGRRDEVDQLYAWCHGHFGAAVAWQPRDENDQWHNRFETDLFYFPNWRWTCLWSPWVGGDIENLHVVLWDRAARSFEDHWRQNYFVSRAVDWLRSERL